MRHAFSAESKQSPTLEFSWNLTSVMCL